MVGATVVSDFPFFNFGCFFFLGVFENCLSVVGTIDELTLYLSK